MKLISSSEAVRFLSQAAPRPWVCRMLRCMILDDELGAYCTQGRVVASTRVYDFTMPISDALKAYTAPEMDKLISENYPEEFAKKLYGKDSMDIVYDDPQIWDNPSEPLRIAVGFIYYAVDVDWENGTIYGDFVPLSGKHPDDMFEDSELLASEFARPDYEYNFSGLCFDRNSIEMMLPSAELKSTAITGDNKPIRRSAGRPPKWEWDEVFAHVVSIAQTPDGLPTGSGAQAKLEALMQEWFIARIGDAPAASQLRRKASIITQSLEMTKIQNSNFDH